MVRMKLDTFDRRFCWGKTANLCGSFSFIWVKIGQFIQNNKKIPFILKYIAINTSKMSKSKQKLE